MDNDAERFEVNLDSGLRTVSRRLKERRKTSGNLWYYVGYVGEIGFVIAIPIAGGALVGAFLDGKWGTYPKMTLSLLFGGIFLSLINFVHTITELLGKKD